jgi:hypothetical protein
MSMDGLPLPAVATVGVEAQHRIGEAVHHREVVKNTKNGPRTAAGFFLEQGQYASGQRGVEMRHRFISQDELGLLQERTSQGHPLLLAARKATDQPMPMAAEFEGIEAMSSHDLFRGRETDQGAPPRMPGERASQDILDGRGIPGEMQLLEDEAYATAELARVMETPVLATVGDGSFMLRAHPRESLEQGGFAGARWAYHGNKPTSRNRHVEVADQYAPATLDREPLDSNMGRVDCGGD